MELILQQCIAAHNKTVILVATESHAYAAVLGKEKCYVFNAHRETASCSPNKYHWLEKPLETIYKLDPGQEKTAARTIFFYSLKE